MSLEIVELCVGCHACEGQCPNNAISAARKMFVINPNKCTECLGDHDLPQCAEICPIEGAIVNEFGEPLNPPGSLTGIPLHLLEQLRESECRP